MYFTAKTLDDLMHQVLERLLHSRNRVAGTRGATRELNGVLLKIANPRARLSRSVSRGKVFSGLGELLWYPGDYYPRDPRNSPGHAVAQRIAGAFPLDDQSTDCSQLFWLEPGVYTAVAVSTSNANTGTVVLEAYVLPYAAD